MSHYIITEHGAHLNQRTQILEDLLIQASNETSKIHHADSKPVERPMYSKVNVLLGRFLEICPV